jgi:hypothetical protein
VEEAFENVEFKKKVLKTLEIRVRDKKLPDLKKAPKKLQLNSHKRPGSGSALNQCGSETMAVIYH